MRSYICALTWCIAVLMPVYSGLAYTLTSGGGASIVVSEQAEAPVRDAAEILKKYLSEILNVSIPVRLDSEFTGDDDAPLILVGRTSLSEPLELEPEEILIRSVGDRLMIQGGDEGDQGKQAYEGTVFAAYEFLERYCGVRWLWPGELGTVVPNLDRIDMGDIDYRFQPRIEKRHVRSTHPGLHPSDMANLSHQATRLGLPFGLYEELLREYAYRGDRVHNPGNWYRAQRMGRRTNYTASHAYTRWYDRYANDHIEWFAMGPDGSREAVRPAQAHLCLSNDELVDKISHVKIEEWRNTTRDSINIAPNDGVGEPHCMCENCKALDVPGKQLEIPFWGEYHSLTDRYLHFFNRIAERVSAEHPDATLGTFAYQEYTHPPVKRKVHPNLYIELAAGGYLSDAYREELRDIWVGWREMGATRLGWRPNLLHSGHGFPLNYARKLAEDIRLFADNGMLTTDFDANVFHWATHGINYYVLSQMLWDPDQNVDDVIRDWCEAGFGPAANYIEQYLDKIEALTNEFAASNISRYYGNTRDAFVADGPKAYLRFIPEGRLLLEQARDATSGDETIRERIDFLEAGLDYAEVQAESFIVLNEHFRNFRAASDPAINDLLNHRLDTLRRIYLTYPLAVNVLNTTRHDARYWTLLGWEWPTADAYADMYTYLDVIPKTWRFRKDPDAQGEAEQWFAVEIDDDGWSSKDIGEWWEQGYHGYGWYRARIDLPEDVDVRSAMLEFDGVDEQAWVYINGELVGEHTSASTGRTPEAIWDQPFTIPASNLKAGETNTIVVQVHASGGRGGIWRPVRMFHIASP
ncbi:DUF4838 domain-containing protein [Phycisphaerales bacterium AB-hyl4]|uniref:DUF4838 domain-containing protein n=1 Tax=Natronomicrosphaera hydrolytica TaxID=3242702 RepID=A0ABV4U5H1_9BACT